MFKNSIAMAAILVLFLSVWFPLAIHVPAWSDESTHMAVGKGLLMTGEPVVFDFDQEKLTERHYTRGLAISYLTKWFYQIGGVSVFVARFIPLLFTLLTFVVYVGYRRVKHQISGGHILMAGVLFFLQAMVLEKSLYVRFYAPLAFFFLLSMILAWEGLQKYEQRKYIHTAIIWIFSAGVLILPTLDNWQIEQIPMFFLAVALLLFGRSKERRIVLTSSIVNHPRRVMIFALTVFIAAPFIAIFFNFLLPKIQGRTDVSFSTYWDNAAGLVRYLWALNVAVLGLGALFRGKWGFSAWLFSTGTLSGLAVGLFNPHAFTFYSRFFYVSVVLTVLGFSGIIADSIPRPRLRRTLLVVYVMLNLLLSFTTFYYDRSTIKQPIVWLNSNLRQNDLLLTFNSNLALEGGGQLTRLVHPITATQDTGQIEDVIKLIDSREQGAVYFLYSHHYQFRDTLYQRTTGVDRAPPRDLFRYLMSTHAGGEDVLPNMRGSGLKKYRADELRTVLVNLKREGFPPPPYRYVSLHYRLLSRLLTSLDIEKQIKSFFGR